MRRAILTLTLVGVVALVGGCTDPDERSCDGRTLTCDPHPRCLPDACRVDGDCPSGLTCGGTRIAASACGGVGLGECHVRQFGGADRFALVDGFGAQVMTVVIAQADPLTVQWSVRSGGEIVACAAFACSPELDPPVPGAGSDDTTPRDIANFDKCAITFAQAAGDRGQIDLSSRARYEVADATCDGAVTAIRVVDDAVVACWVYDDRRIVAASEVIRLPVEATMRLLGLVGDGTCGPDGRVCYRGDQTGTYGLCRGGVCQPRCANASDCLQADAFANPDRDPPPTTCEWACEPVLGSQAGVCVPAP